MTSAVSFLVQIEKSKTISNLKGAQEKHGFQRLDAVSVTLWKVFISSAGIDAKSGHV
jgi:hypothetical protein